MSLVLPTTPAILDQDLQNTVHVAIKPGTVQIDYLRQLQLTIDHCNRLSSWPPPRLDTVLLKALASN